MAYSLGHVLCRWYSLQYGNGQVLILRLQTPVYMCA